MQGIRLLPLQSVCHALWSYVMHTAMPWISNLIPLLQKRQLRFVNKSSKVTQLASDGICLAKQALLIPESMLLTLLYTCTGRVWASIPGKANGWSIYIPLSEKQDTPIHQSFYLFIREKKKKQGKVPLTGWFRNALGNHYSNQCVIPSNSVPSNFISMPNFKCYRRGRENKLKDYCQFLLMKWFIIGQCIIK